MCRGAGRGCDEVWAGIMCMGCVGGWEEGMCEKCWPLIVLMHR